MLCLVCMIQPTQSFAGPPVAFGSGGCPSGFTCEVNVTSVGMEQRILTNASGTQYIQVTVQDGSTNNGGRLDYESFINGSSNNTQGGVSAKVGIRETGAFNVDYTTILNLGWANTNGAALDINQTVIDNVQGINFEQNFDYLQNQNSQGGATGYSYGIREKVVGSGFNSGGGTQTFVLRRAGGDFVNNGSASLSAASDMGMMDGGGDGGGGGGGGGGMRKASIGGRALSTTNTFQAASFDTFGTDGTNTGPVGDPQTLPATNTVYGPDGNAAAFPGVTPDNINASLSNDNQNNAMVSTLDTNIGNSNGEITSDSNASGPAAPTGTINVATGDPMGMGGGGGLPGGTVSWRTGDEVQVIWIGQSCSGCVVSGGMGGMNAGASGVFSFQQYDNISSGASAASRSITSTSPLNWQTNPFGAQPGL